MPRHSLRRPLNRRTFLQATAATALGLAASQVRFPRRAYAEDPPDVPLTAAEALQRLVDGNQRFRDGQATHPHQSAANRLDVARGQHPYAVVLGCIDSRVSPEIVFDQGLGDLFVARVAGNIIDPAGLGSIQFGVEEFHVPLVLVLGHSRCGAVIATADIVEHGLTAPGDIGVIVEAIRPAVAAAAEMPGDLIANAVRNNVRNSVAVLSADPLLSAEIAHGTLGVVGAEYDLVTGAVEVLL